jgi:AraC-like DNA-binding protein
VERQLRSDLHAPPGFEAPVTADSPRHEIDVVLYQSAFLRIGRWRCPATHPCFRDSGPASETLFVFPRESVRIQHEGSAPFVADANTVTYYNAGQRYRRWRLSAWGDRCEWFAFVPSIVAESLATHEPAAKDRLERPFRFSHGPADHLSYLRQRLVFEHVARERIADRLFVEETMCDVLTRVTAIAYGRLGVTARSRKGPKHDVDVAEAARDVIARRYREPLSLDDIGRSAGASVFHLARVFRQRTGFSLHQYRNQLRLRFALERLTDAKTELSALALDLGFSSHSHFTETFRRTFGRTPSSLRKGYEE